MNFDRGTKHFAAYSTGAQNILEIDIWGYETFSTFYNKKGAKHFSETTNRRLLFHHWSFLTIRLHHTLFYKYKSFYTEFRTVSIFCSISRFSSKRSQLLVYIPHKIKYSNTVLLTYTWGLYVYALSLA